MPRKLSGRFMAELQGGCLKPFVDFCKADDTLLFCIRPKDKVNIYYRGGSLVTIQRIRESYSLKFNPKYLELESGQLLPLRKEIYKGLSKKLNNNAIDGAAEWIKAIPQLKQIMDIWFGEHRKPERDLQQLMVLENNRMCVKGHLRLNDTDYFICDIEYSRSGAHKFRADMVALHWPSTTPAHRTNKNIGLTFVEMKVADQSIQGKSGLLKHIADMEALFSDANRLDMIGKEFLETSNQLSSLGLLKLPKEQVVSISSDKPEFIIVLTAHNPPSTILRSLLSKVPECKNIVLKIMVANFTGFGMHDECLYTLKAFKEQFSNQICCR